MLKAKRFYVLTIGGIDEPDDSAVLKLEPDTLEGCNRAIAWQVRGGFDRAGYVICEYDRDSELFRDSCRNAYRPGIGPYTAEAWERFLAELKALPRTRWRFEEATKTIRTSPGNHWVATFDSWDGALDHEANARLAARAPQLADALERMTRAFTFGGTAEQVQALTEARDALA